MDEGQRRPDPKALIGTFQFRVTLGARLSAREVPVRPPSLETTPCKRRFGHATASRVPPRRSQHDDAPASPSRLSLSGEREARRAFPPARQRHCERRFGLEIALCEPPQPRDDARASQGARWHPSLRPRLRSHLQRRRGAPRSGGRFSPKPPAYEPSCGASREPPRRSQHDDAPASPSRLSPASAERDARPPPAPATENPRSTRRRHPSAARAWTDRHRRRGSRCRGRGSSPRQSRGRARWCWCSRATR